MSHDNDKPAEPPKTDYREVNAKAFIEIMEPEQRERFINDMCNLFDICCEYKTEGTKSCTDTTL